MACFALAAVREDVGVDDERIRDLLESVGPAEERLMGHYRMLNEELGKSPWATGPMFGNADIVLMTAAAGYHLRGGPITEFPNVVKWLDACLARPSVRDNATPLVKAGKPV